MANKSSNRQTGRRLLNPVVSRRRVCKCDICQKWSPLHRRIMAKLRGKDRKLFDEFLMMEMNQSDALGAATAKLEGEWPGWEWMKEAVKQHFGKPANAQAEARGEAPLPPAPGSTT